MGTHAHTPTQTRSNKTDNESSWRGDHTLSHVLTSTYCSQISVTYFVNNNQDATPEARKKQLDGKINFIQRFRNSPRRGRCETSTSISYVLSLCIRPSLLIYPSKEGQTDIVEYTILLCLSVLPASLELYVHRFILICGLGLGAGLGVA